jgi:hypothetical protein
VADNIEFDDGAGLSPEVQRLLKHIQQLSPEDREELRLKIKKKEWEDAMEAFKVQEDQLRVLELQQRKMRVQKDISDIPDWDRQ